ncbi:aldehyde dehydrogenase family protein [Azotobacter chroococcum]|uniref:aldehyde dehydrogenase family protein n=1 Tax=Azotobacter chroococcum TaxID=353 RepID=UPI0009E61F2C|nr:aldehyde dehydrogenase family protein [Azotobacter chroococcum]
MKPLTREAWIARGPVGQAARAGTGGERGLRTARLRPFANDVGDGWIEFHPIGVLLAVEPWNLPIYELSRVIAPAIAVGNPVMLKHASIVPQCAALFEDRWHA